MLSPGNVVQKIGGAFTTAGGILGLTGSDVKLPSAEDIMNELSEESTTRKAVGTGKILVGGAGMVFGPDPFTKAGGALLTASGIIDVTGTKVTVPTAEEVIDRVLDALLDAFSK